MIRKEPFAGNNQKKFVKRQKRVVSSKKRCKLCGDKDFKKDEIDYKNASFLKNFLTDCGKILSSRVSGNCASCQKKIENAIKISRIMGLIQFCPH